MTFPDQDDDVLAPDDSAPKEFLESLYRSIGALQHDFRNKNLNQLVASFVEGETVLDVGCGTGGLVAVLRDRGKDAIGLEPNPNLVRAAAQLNPTAIVQCGSGLEASNLGQRFDTVTMVDVLEHILDDLGQLQLLQHGLRPGGQLVLVVPAHPWLFGQRDRLNGHHRRYSRKRLRWVLHTAGFRIERMRSWNLLGVLPYWFSEQILGRPLEVRLRHTKETSRVGSLLRQLLNFWLRQVENRISFGCGLSLICVARSPAVPASTREADRGA